jgi:hypothetical protein
VPGKEKAEKDCNLNGLHRFEIKEGFGGSENQCFIFEIDETISFIIDVSYLNPYRFIFLQSVALLMPNSWAAVTLFPQFFSKVLFTISASAFSRG